MERGCETAYEHVGYKALVVEMQMAFSFLSGQPEFQAMHRRLAGQAVGVHPIDGIWMKKCASYFGNENFSGRR